MRNRKRQRLSGRGYTTQIPTPKYFVRESATESLPTIVRKLAGVKLKEGDCSLVRRFTERLDADEPLNPTLYEEARLRELRSTHSRQIDGRRPQKQKRREPEMADDTRRFIEMVRSF